MKKMMVIGTGIVGSFIAHTLSKYDVQVLVMEKHNDICEEISAANSAIVHAGYDPKDGSLKARLNKRGADIYPYICSELQVDCIRCGAYVVACGKEEETTLQALYERGKNRGVHVTYVDIEEARGKEPHLSKGVTKVMEVEDTSIIMPWEVCNALLDECVLNGVELHLDEEVLAIEVRGDKSIVTTNKQCYVVDVLINAAGAGAQHIMQMVEKEPVVEVTYKRGQYFILSNDAKGYVQRVIYPVPGPKGKGVLALPTTHGNILIGPNNEVVDIENTSTTFSGLQEVKKHIAKTLIDVPYQEVIHTYSGLRPTGNHGDFYIQYSRVSNHIIHCACIDSPGLASAPAIAQYVMEELIQPVVDVQRKHAYVHRSSAVCMQRKSIKERNAIIKKEKRYGHMVCRCERVSEQEVIDCIHRPCGARSIKGVKKRVRPGMGKCQGGFCEIEIAKLLAQELHIPLYEVRYDEKTYFMEVKGVRK